MATTDGSVDSVDVDGETKRDIKNHLLFEIATEVANRGSLLVYASDSRKR